MALVAGTARLELTAVGGTRLVVLQASASDADRGSRIDFTLTHSTTGVTPPAVPQTLLARIYIDGVPDAHGTITQLLEVALPADPGSYPNQFSIWLTHNLTSGGSLRLGTLQMYLLMERTMVGTYNVSTTLNANTPGAGNTLTRRDQGYIRSNPLPASRAVVTLSNVAAGGAKDAPADYLETLHHRITLPVPAYDDPDFGFTHGLVRDTAGTTIASQTTNGAGAATHDASFTINDTFDRALSTVRGTATARNAGLTGLPWILVTETPDTITVDPRVYFRTLQQENVSRYTTAPEGEFALDQVSRQMLNSDLSYLLKKATTARGRTVTSALAWVEGLRDGAGQLADRTRAVATGNLPAESRPGGGGVSSGWGYPSVAPGWMVWSEAKPGGTWVYDVRSISTAGATAAGMVVDADRFLTMLAQHPRYTVVAGAGHPAAVNQSEHWHPGDALLIGAALFDRQTLTLATPDDGTQGTPVPSVVIGRFNTAIGAAQYLAADLTWKTLATPSVAYQWPLMASPGDPRVRIMQLSAAQTVGFSNATLFFIATLGLGGTPYPGNASLDAPGPASPHGRSFVVMTSGGPVVKGAHFTPGMHFQAGLSVVDTITNTVVQVNGFKQIAILRLQDGGLNAGRGEYLAADGTTWVPIVDNTTQLHYHDLTESRPGSGIYLKTWLPAQTADWGEYDIFTIGRVKHDFFEYGNCLKEISVGKPYNHDRFRINPLHI